MSTSISNSNACCCSNQQTNNTKKETIVPNKFQFSFKSLSSIVLSVLIAFFPKCPLCWAAYMSVFGFLGLAQLPFMGWLLPVLLLLFGIYLVILYKKSSKGNYLPFQLSLIGASFLASGKLFFPTETWIAIIGMICIISSSLSLSFGKTKINEMFKQNNKLKSI
ncbi:MAG: hypothetical protein QM535_16050 [Limnohabitans sp.]|nr:hypothetical protein [Limnohabitans sp.]